MQTSRFVLLTSVSPFPFNLTVPLPQEVKHCLLCSSLLGWCFLYDGRSGRKAMQWGQVTVELDWSTWLDAYFICGRDGHSSSIS